MHSIQALHHAYARGDVKPSEVLEEQLARVERLNPAHNAITTLLADEAWQSARALDALLAEHGPLALAEKPLFGVPVTVKDIFRTEGAPTTAGSSRKVWEGGPDATAVARLKQAGAMLLGKTNLHEFAYGVTTDNPHHGATRNPWNPERTAGGSSGGSGAAVALGLGFASLGTDTGGSVRIPAACCGVVGIKSTFGAVSRAGVFPLSATLDHVGVLAGCCADARATLQAIWGTDARDAATLGTPPTWLTPRAPETLCIGVPDAHFLDLVDDDVRARFDEALRAARNLGAEVVSISLPHIGWAEAAQFFVAGAEAAAVHREALLSAPQTFGRDVLTRLRTTLLITADQYIDAQRMRAVIQEDFATALAQVDVLVTPTLPLEPFPLGTTDVTLGSVTMLARQAFLRLTSPINLVGLPALTTPVGLGRQGLPVGVQWIGRPFDEGTLLALGEALELAFPPTRPVA